MPDISFWNIYNVKNIYNIFYGCKSKLKLPYFYILKKYKNNIIFELKYKNKENDKDNVKIFDKNFIEKNKDKGTIIYNNCEFESKENFEDIDSNNHKDTINFLLCLDKNINDLSYIFFACESLISVEYYKINHKLYELKNELKFIFDDSKINQLKINNNNSIKDTNSINIYIKIVKIYLKFQKYRITIIQISFHGCILDNYHSMNLLI